MHTRRSVLATFGVVSTLGLAGCSASGSPWDSISGEEGDPYAPDVTPEPLPDDVPLVDGLARTENAPYVAVEDHLAVSEAHVEYLEKRPAFRYLETVTTTLYDAGAEVVDWEATGEVIDSQTTRRETTVTEAAYLKEQTFEFERWDAKERHRAPPLERYIDHTEYFAVDAHVFRFDADYEEYDVEAGETDDKTTRYGRPGDAEREFRDELRKLREPRFGGGDIVAVDRVEDGVKILQYADRSGPDDGPHSSMDWYDFHYWVIDDAGYVRERRKMTVFPQNEDRLSVNVESKRWAPLEESPGQLRPDWVDEAREWEYPEEWYDEYDGALDR